MNRAILVAIVYIIVAGVESVKMNLNEENRTISTKTIR